MNKIARSVLTLVAGSALLFTTGCPEEGVAGVDGETLGNALGGLLDGDGDGEATGGSSDGENANTDAPGADNLGASADVDFEQFLEPGDTYFGPAGGDAEFGSGVTGQAAAGSSYKGEVGILVFVRDKKGMMKVVNLNNKRRYDVKDTNGAMFSTPTDTLGGRDFASIYITSIDSLTKFTFDRHFPGSSPARCNQYTGSFTGSAESGHYVASATATQASCRASGL